MHSRRLNEIEDIYEETLEKYAAFHKKQYFSVAFFGSARLPNHSPEFNFVMDLAEALVEKIPVDIVTGGGPGLMEAASEGAMNGILNNWHNLRAGTKPKIYSLSISLPYEEERNPYVHVDKTHKNFTTRLQSFVNLIQGAYIGAGGIGTLLELSLLWQLKQMEHIPKEFPLVVSNVWKPMLEMFFDMTSLQRKHNKTLVNDTDMDLLVFSDNINEIVEIFNDAYHNWITSCLK